MLAVLALVLIVVPNSPGGQLDLALNAMRPTLEAQGHKVVALYRPGAEGALGLAKAKAEGRLVITTVDALKEEGSGDFEVLQVIGSAPVAVVSHSRSWFQNGNTVAVNTVYNRILVRSIASTLGIDLLQIPYSNVSTKIADLVSGRVDIGTLSVRNSVDLSQAGKLRLLAITSPSRHSRLPDVPTLCERGLPSMVTTFVVAIGKGAPDVLGSAKESLGQAIRSPTMLQFLEDWYMQPSSLIAGSFCSPTK
jgi:tripartite-type tricarboxylate transporter receptor subunit TctC